MRNRKISDKGYYELKTDSYNDIKMENRLLDYDMPLHFHRSIEFLYIKKGTYRTTVRTKDYVFEKDEIVFVPAFYQHSAEDGDADSIITLVPQSYSQDFAPFFDGKTFAVELKDREFNRKRILPVLELILSDRDCLKNSAIAKGYINVIYGLFAQRYGYVECDNFADRNIIIEIIKFIDDHCAENLTLDRMSEQFGYNKSYLSRIFNKTIGTSLPDYINQVRIQKFVRMYIISGGEGSIAEYAFSCGFESVPSFYRAFKRLYGMSPKDYFKTERYVFW